MRQSKSKDNRFGNARRYAEIHFNGGASTAIEIDAGKFG